MAAADEGHRTMIIVTGLFHVVVAVRLSLMMMMASTSEAAESLNRAPLPIASLNRSNFPTDFVFGVASSAYQYEGAANEGGRGPSLWDSFTHIYPDKIKDGSNGTVAVDSYHRYQEDVELIKEIGFDAYRFSISWSRVLPRGKLSGGVNQAGIAYYNDLINELHANGILPFVTLFHWDLPQALEDEYGGFLSAHIVDDYRDYVDICFREFGDRVKHWITLNEPWSYSSGGYATGTLAPARCSDWLQQNCTGGDSATEPYTVTHNQLLAHAAAVQVYKQNYQASQNGQIGISLVSQWFVPFSDDKQHHRAAKRAFDFMVGWFMEPLTKGEYPQSMRSLVGNRLPQFSEEQSRILNGSFDFVGLNYYTSSYAAHLPYSDTLERSYDTDSSINRTAVRHGIPIGPKAASDWLYAYPRGIREVLRYTKRKYDNPVIYITENGIDEINNETQTLEQALVDRSRIEYHNSHLSFLRKAIQDGVDVRGYFAWSLLDNFEWNWGYTVRFGINYVDYRDGLTRYPKLSANWFYNFLKH